MTSKLKNVPICVDFDGTIVEHNYPLIGDPVPMAIETLKKYQSAGALLILFTMRSDKTLSEAVKYCNDNGIQFHGINRNPSQTWTNSPKAYGEMYIDDAAVGCPLIYQKGKRPMVDWLEIDKLINKIVE